MITYSFLLGSVLCIMLNDTCHVTAFGSFPFVLYWQRSADIQMSGGYVTHFAPTYLSKMAEWMMAEMALWLFHHPLFPFSSQRSSLDPSFPQ